MIINMTLFLVLPFIMYQPTRTPAFIFIWTSIYIGILTSVLVMVTNIKYEFHEDFLSVKGGPLKKKIPYSKVKFASSTHDIFDGYRVLTAKEAIEIVYGKGWWGNVKISPEDEETFLSLLKYHCPQAEIEM